MAVATGTAILGGALLAGGGAVAGGAMSAKGAKSAASASADATRAATQAQLDMYYRGLAETLPQRTLGYQAMNTLGRELYGPEYDMNLVFDQNKGMWVTPQAAAGQVQRTDPATGLTGFYTRDQIPGRYVPEQTDTRLARVISGLMPGAGLSAGSLGALASRAIDSGALSRTAQAPTARPPVSAAPVANPGPYPTHRSVGEGWTPLGNGDYLSPDGTEMYVADLRTTEPVEGAIPRPVSSTTRYGRGSTPPGPNPFAMDTPPIDLTTSPLYNLQRDKGTESINQQLAARGLYSSGYGLGTLNDFYLKLNANEVARKQALAEMLAGFGSSASGQAASMANSTGGNLASLYMQGGANQASALNAAANARAGMITGGVNAIGSGLSNYGAYQGFQDYLSRAYPAS